MPGPEDFETAVDTDQGSSLDDFQDVVEDQLTSDDEDESGESGENGE